MGAIGRSLALAVLAAGAGLGRPSPCLAEEAAPPVPWYETIRLNGFLSTSYSYNLNRPASHTNALRVFDLADNSFTIDDVELVVQKPVSKPRESGFRADLVFGSSVPRVSAAAGLLRDDAGVAGDIDLQQAFASYVAPFGAGLRLDVGKFVTHFGYEVIDGYDGWNDNATRSLLFGYAIPFTHTGVRASCAFGARATATLMVVNGWDDARDNNTSKSVGGQITLAPAASLTFALNGMTGPERTGNESDHRSLLDVVGVWKLTPRWSLGANGDWGTEQKGLGPDDDARWSGVAAYLRLSQAGALAVSLRGEIFDDTDGVRTGTPQRLSEVTLTPEARVSPSMLVRGDLRLDHSDRPVFERAHGITDRQPSILVSALYSF